MKTADGRDKGQETAAKHKAGHTGLLAADCKTMWKGGKENKKCLNGSRGTEGIFHLPSVGTGCLA